MKKVIIIMVTLIGANYLFGGAEPHSDIHIGVSPFLNQSDRQNVRQALARFVLQAPPGTRIVCDDGYNLQTVATFDVPRLRFDSPANRARTLAGPLAALGQWFTATNGVSSPELRDSAALKVPEYADAIASQATGSPRLVILLGSPFAIYVNEPSFSMSDLRVPSDGHLQVGIQQSPYGTADRKDRLANAVVRWCYLNESIWGNDLHRTLVRRFWTAFVQAISGRLLCFSADLQAAFALPSAPALSPVATVRLDPQDTKLEMRVARPRQIPTWLPSASTATGGYGGNLPGGASTAGVGQPAVTTARSGVSGNPPIASGFATRPAAVSTAPPRDLAQPIMSPVNIGIMWQSSDPTLDLDLYVQAHPGAADLFFGRNRTQEGEHVYDWRQPNAQADFEWVRLRPPVRLDQVAAWVNIYQGRGPISGTVTVHFENATYTGSFQINAPIGNGGADLALRDRSPYWTRLNIQEIVRRGSSPR